MQTSNIEHSTSNIESPDDFIHKMSVCLKELRESHRWLLLVKMVPLVKSPAPAAELIAETEELIHIFHASIRTARNRKNARQKGDV